MSSIFMMNEDKTITAQLYKDGTVMFTGAINKACYLSEEVAEYRNINFAVRIADLVFALEAGQDIALDMDEEPILHWLESVGYCFDSTDYEQEAHDEFVIEWFALEDECGDNFVCR